jgi:hypothetical protein
MLPGSKAVFHKERNNIAGKRPVDFFLSRISIEFNKKEDFKR